MAKPPFRDYDDTSKRGDDLRYSGPLGTLEVSGKNVVIIMLMAGMVGLGFYHHNKLTEGHEQFAQSQQRFLEAMILHTCVISLNEEERKEFRREQKYCGNWQISRELEKVIKPEAKQ
jgi:hypothetical protein